MALPPARDLLASSRISAGGAEPPGRSAIGGGERVTLTAGARPRPRPAPPPRARRRVGSLALARAAPPRRVRASVDPERGCRAAGCS